MDQAATLRKITDPDSKREIRVMAITSGKGGVGKTNVVTNLAIALSRMGKKVLILDADLGLGNIDILLGLAPRYNLRHLLSGEKSVSEIMIEGPSGILILPASSGFEELTALSMEQQLNLLSAIEKVSDRIDILLIDTGAGISSNVIYFNLVAQDIIVVVSPEPTSITDAYALMKILSVRHNEKSFRLLVNLAKTPQEAKDVYRRLSIVADRFLNISIDYLGDIPLDDHLPLAVCQQKAAFELFPDSRASKAFMGLARQISELPMPESPKGNIQFLQYKQIGR